ncbi:uncharacterized protein LOC119724924 [Patiria miniata]|uniref:Uncharacterized protein n=1 Tax=Patiria miniata TaxID=46514 RepID=A0A913ZM81_PATMI|nr:uncharacterized protein LOC119724924 [Patiria miniata]
MHGGVVKVPPSSCDHDMAMTSGTSSQSDGSDSPAISDHNSNNTDTVGQSGGGTVEIKLIVSIDGGSDEANTPRVLTRVKHEQPAGRSGSVPDVMRLLPPIPRDHDSDSAVQQGLASGGTGLSLRSTRSSSPLLLLDRSGGPGLCFRAADSEKMLPVLLSADAGLHPVARSHGLLGHSNKGGSLSGISRPLSPRPPSPSLLHHPSKDKPAGLPHHLHRRLSEEKHILPLDPEPIVRTREGPLNDITDVHPSLLRRRSCQSPNRLMFSERRRASEGVLNVTPSQLGLHPKSRTQIEPRLQQSKASPSSQRVRREIGELMSTVPSRKPKGQKTAHGQGLNRLSRLSSASVESVNKHDTSDMDDLERQRILHWLDGVKRGMDGQTDKEEDLGTGHFEPPLSRSSTETAIRIIHKDRT